MPESDLPESDLPALAPTLFFKDNHIRVAVRCAPRDYLATSLWLTRSFLCVARTVADPRAPPKFEGSRVIDRLGGGGSQAEMTHAMISRRRVSH